MTKFIAALALLALAPSAMAQTASYVFDSVSKIDLHKDRISVLGTLQGTATPTTVTFADNVNADFRYAVNRCVPVLLTMIEKPGRYLLHLTIVPDAVNIGIVSCGLEIRT